MRLRAAHHALPPPVLDGRFGRLARLVVVVEGAGGHVAVELRAVRCERHLEFVEYFFGSPFGLVGVCTINGGTALMMAAFDTRLSPWRAI